MNVLLRRFHRGTVVTLTICLVGLFNGRYAYAQQDDVFEGRVVYSMSGEDHPGMATLTYYIRPDAMRLEMDAPQQGKRNRNSMGMGAGGSGIMIFRSDKIYMLMPEQKMYMEMPLQMDDMEEWYDDEEDYREGAEAENDRLEMAATNETKVILGYTATKYVFKDDEDDYRTEIWFTDELGAFIPMQTMGQGRQEQYQWQSNVKHTKLFPLEILVYDEDNTLNTKMTATEVKPMKVDEEKVKIPEGYRKMGLGSLFKQQ
jgi:hypothetical protein